MARRRSIFDIVGPVMIGPSSSHTAGAVRLGRLARALFGGQPQRVVIRLHGSFASTGAGHGTDLALVAGLLGLGPADPRIREARSLAKGAGMTVSFEEVDLGEMHPNTAEFEMWGPGTSRMLVRGSSLGGGDVEVTEVDGFEVSISGELPVLLVEHEDRPGEIAGVSSLLAEQGINIASMQVSREHRGARALMLIETDVETDDTTARSLGKLPGISAVRRVPAV
jgi:L-serine dehydratase